MDRFTFLNEMNSFLNLDSEITKGRVPRWQQQKNAESSNQSLNQTGLNLSRTAKLSVSYNGYASAINNNANSNKTPNKNKSPSRKSPTPNKNGPKTPSGGDRFIPNRSAMNFELGNFLVGFLKLKSFLSLYLLTLDPTRATK